MTKEEKIKMAKLLVSYKRAAFKAGLNKKLFSDFKLESNLGKTNFPAGKYMEVVMAWMLAYFRKVSGLFMKVQMFWEEDLYEDTDFKIMSADSGYRRVDMKFDNDYGESQNGVYIIHVYPSTPGHADSKKTQTGMEALTSILSVSFETSTLIRAMSGRKDLAALMNAVWQENSEEW